MDATAGVAGYCRQTGTAVGAVASRVAGGVQMNRLFRPLGWQSGVLSRRAALVMPRSLVLSEAEKLYEVFCKRAGTQRLTFELSRPQR